MPEKFKGGGYPDFLTPINVGPHKGDAPGQPSPANVVEADIMPPDPTGVVPKSGKGKGKKIGM